MDDLAMGSVKNQRTSLLQKGSWPQVVVGLLGAFVCFASFTNVQATNSKPEETVVCTQPAETSTKFIEAYHAIALHGDLKDIAFIEKQLQIKLRAVSSLSDKYPPNKKPHQYEADSLWGNPIKVTLIIIDDPHQIVIINGQYVHPDYDAYLSFQGPDWSFIHNCLRIPETDFTRPLGDGFKEENEAFPHAPGSEKSKDMESVAEKNARIQVTYAYLKKDNLIYDAAIKQMPPKITLPSGQSQKTD
jgi:hypothetical protein